MAVVYATFGEDDGDEVDAGGAEKWEGCGFCEELWNCQYGLLFARVWDSNETYPDIYV